MKYIHIFFQDISDIDTLVTKLHVGSTGYDIVGNTSLCVPGGTDLTFFINDNAANVLQASTSANILFLINEEIESCYNEDSSGSSIHVIGEVFTDSEYPGTDRASSSPTPYAECVSPNQEICLHFEDDDLSNIGWSIFQLPSLSSSLKPVLIQQSSSSSNVDYTVCLAPDQYYVSVFAFGEEVFAGNWSIRQDQADIYSNENSSQRDVYLLTLSETVGHSTSVEECAENENLFSLSLEEDGNDSQWSLVKLDQDQSQTIVDHSSASLRTCLPSGRYYWDITSESNAKIVSTLEVNGAIIHSGSSSLDSVHFSL